MQLQFLKQSRWEKKWYWLSLIAICLIGYWPLTFGFFSVKNDAIQYFLPFRYNIISTIQNGELPLWSPFIYLGYPVHGDMQSGAWNPFVWLISLFGSYDITLFHIEYLVYIFLSGAGMFKLSKLISDQPAIRLFAAIAYMLSGYMFGSGQFINWVASAAFIPFIIYYYYQFLSTGKLAAAITTSVFCWLLFVCGYTADTIYVFYILLIMLLASAWYRKEALRNRSYLKKFAWHHLLMILVLLGLCAPALISYLELLPYYTRGAGASYEQSIENAYELKNLVSFLNPWPTWNDDYHSITDPTGRNIFMGIYVICFFVFYFFVSWKRSEKFLLALLVFSFLFSLGDGFLVRKAAYYFVPGMASFRHPSHFRLYVILPMILLACKGMSAIIHQQKPHRKFYLVCLSLLLICLAMTAYSYSPQVTRIFAQLPEFNRMQLKQWLYSFNQDSLLFTGFALQAIFLMALLFLSRRTQFPIKTVLILHLTNLLVFQALFPMTFVSKTKPAVINKILADAKASYNPDAVGQSLLYNSADSGKYSNETSLYYFYSHNIGIAKKHYSPSGFSSMDEFLQNDSLYDYIANKPVAYLLDSSNHSSGHINSIIIENNRIEIETESDKKTMLHLTQNFHHNWKVEADGKTVVVQKANIAFMAVPLTPGKHLVRWIYSPRFVYFGLVIFCIALVYVVIFYMRTLLKTRHEK